MIGRYIVCLDLNIILNFSLSFNRTKSFSYSFCRLNLDISFNFFYSRFNNVFIINNITRYINSLSLTLIFVFNIHSYRFLINKLIILIIILRSDLFDGFVNGWLNDYSLSSWLDYLFSYNSWFTNNSFCDNFRFGCNSLGYDSRFCLNSLLHNLCVLEHILHVHRVASSKGCISLCLSREALSHYLLLIKWKHQVRKEYQSEDFWIHLLFF